MEMSQAEKKLINKVSKWKEPYKSLGLMLHTLIRETKPELLPSSMYGMPAYRVADTKKLICLFRHDTHLTFSLLDDAKIKFTEGQGKMQPVAWQIESFNDDVIKQLKDILVSIV